MLSLSDTYAIKGIAIMLMLFHHLFYIQNGLFDDIHLYGAHYLVNEVGIMAKVCVTIFVLLSGYGLTIVAEKNGGIPNLIEFYERRFKKLFLNYWLTWMIFVPISVFVYGYTFKDAYGSNIPIHLMSDIFGVHMFAFGNAYGYNPTWWFYSCIIALYLLFPLLYRLSKCDSLTAILMSIAISFLPISQITVIKFNILAFVAGILMAIRNTPPSNIKSRILAILLLTLFAIERNLNNYPPFLDCLMSIILVHVFLHIKLNCIIRQTLIFLGKHSMNIFLFHTFIYYFWCRDFIYASRNPIIIFATLLVACLPISMVLEWIKKYTIYKL